MNRNKKHNGGPDECAQPQPNRTDVHNIEQRKCASGNERASLKVQQEDSKQEILDVYC